jgi:hypothetical protein
MSKDASYEQYIKNDTESYDSEDGVAISEMTSNKVFVNNEDAVSAIDPEYLEVFINTFPDEAIDWSNCTFVSFDEDTKTIECLIGDKEQDILYDAEENLYYTIFRN